MIYLTMFLFLLVYCYQIDLNKFDFDHYICTRMKRIITLDKTSIENKTQSLYGQHLLNQFIQN